MTDFPNTLSWSQSRMRTFDSCKRKYYYDYYLSWGGWEPNCDPLARRAYVLKKMTSLPMLVGSIVHEVILDILKRWKASNMTTSLDEALKSASLKWQQSLKQAGSGKWDVNPKYCCCLLEFYKNQEGLEARAMEMWPRVEGSIRSFYQSRTWADLQHTSTARWLALDSDKIEAFEVLGIPVYARPDLSYDVPTRSGERKCRVFDFKTGQPRDSDLLQIRYYALTAASRWGFDPEKVKTRLVYLYPELVEDEIPPEAERLADARATLLDSFERMKSVLDNVETNEPRDISYFPVTERKSLCRWCNYGELCQDKDETPAPDARPASAADENDPFADL